MERGMSAGLWSQVKLFKIDLMELYHYLNYKLSQKLPFLNDSSHKYCFCVLKLFCF